MLKSKKTISMLLATVMVLSSCFVIVGASENDNVPIPREESVTPIFYDDIDDISQIPSFAMARAGIWVAGASLYNSNGIITTPFFNITSGTCQVLLRGKASTTGVLTTKLIRSNGAQSQPITVNINQTGVFSTTLTWDQVANAQWQFTTILSPAIYDRSWDMIYDVYDGR